MKGERNWIRSIRGPVTLITLGGLFALQNFTPYDFGQTWPVLLIVFGLLSLLGRATRSPYESGQPGNFPPPPPPGAYPPAPPNPPQPPYTGGPR